jgi:hypothetical protein
VISHGVFPSVSRISSLPFPDVVLIEVTVEEEGFVWRVPFVVYPTVIQMNVLLSLMARDKCMHFFHIFHSVTLFPSDVYPCLHVMYCLLVEHRKGHMGKVLDTQMYLLLTNLKLKLKINVDYIKGIRSVCFRLKLQVWVL